jgi:hypothetical protein
MEIAIGVISAIVLVVIIQILVPDKKEKEDDNG